MKLFICKENTVNYQLILVVVGEGALKMDISFRLFLNKFFYITCSFQALYWLRIFLGDRFWSKVVTSLQQRLSYLHWEATFQELISLNPSKCLSCYTYLIGLDSLGYAVVVLYLKLCFTLKKYSPRAYSRK